MTSNVEKKEIRVFVIDDCPMLIEGIRGIIEREADMAFCGGATTAAEGLREAFRLQPSVCIVDLHLPDGNGLDLVAEIRSHLPDTRVLVFSMYEDRVFAERSIRAGANGYLEKTRAPGKLIEAVRQVHAGGMYLSQDTANAVLSRLMPAGASDKPSVESLSEREFQIFEWLGRGLTNPEIADQCCLSIRTVETYYSRIKEKLQLANTARMRQFAIEWSKQTCAA
jgi:DNA-binding NarL/FixJ family response regulator